MDLIDKENSNLLPDEMTAFEKSGYQIIHEPNTRYWDGSSNVYCEVTFLERTDEFSIVQRIKLSDKITATNRLIIRSVDIELKFPVEQFPFTIETNRQFRFFTGKTDDSIQNFYAVEGFEAVNLTSELQNCLYNLKEEYLRIEMNSNHCIVSMVDENNRIKATEILDLVKSIVHQTINRTS